MPRQPATWLVFATLLVLAAGCGAPPGAPDSAPLPQRALPTWPGPPDDPRIVFESSFATPADLGVEQGVLARLGRLLFGDSAVRLVRPMGVVVVGPLIYVTDPGANGVHRFDRAEGEHTLIHGPDDTALPSPIGIAAGTDGRVYVTDSARREVLVIEPGADVARVLPLEVGLRQPTGIAVDSEHGELYVVDTLAHVVRVFDRSGHHRRDFGAQGDAVGHFNHPTLLWRNADGTLLVADALNFRVQAFSAAGDFLHAFGRHGDGSGDMARVKGVASDRGGHVYVVDALFHAVQIFDDQGRFLLAFGRQGQKAGEFWLPTGIFIDATDRIYVADSYNRRVQVFRYLEDSP